MAVIMTDDDDDTDCSICWEPLNGERYFHRKCVNAEKVVAAHLAGYRGDGSRAGVKAQEAESNRLPRTTKRY